MKRVSFIVRTLAVLAFAAAGGTLLVRHRRCSDFMAGGCANHRRRSLHAGYTLADLT